VLLWQWDLVAGAVVPLIAGHHNGAVLFVLVRARALWRQDWWAGPFQEVGTVFCSCDHSGFCA